MKQVQCEQRAIQDQAAKGRRNTSTACSKASERTVCLSFAVWRLFSKVQPTSRSEVMKVHIWVGGELCNRKLSEFVPTL